MDVNLLLYQITLSRVFPVAVLVSAITCGLWHRRSHA